MNFFRNLFRGGNRREARESYCQGNQAGTQGDHTQAIARFTEAVRLDPTFADAYYVRALAYEAVQEYDKAQVDLERVLQLRPSVIQDTPWEIAQQGLERDIARVAARRGLTLCSQGKYEQAIADFSAAIRYDPKWHIYFERGQAYYRTHRFHEAVADLAKAAERNPEDKQARCRIYHLLGNAYRALGDVDRAIANLKITVRLDPSSPTTYKDRGLAYLQKGEHSLAVADFTEAIRLDPQDADSYASRAKAYRELRDERSASCDEGKAKELK